MSSCNWRKLRWWSTSWTPCCLAAHSGLSPGISQKLKVKNACQMENYSAMDSMVSWLKTWILTSMCHNYLSWKKRCDWHQVSDQKSIYVLGVRSFFCGTVTSPPFCSANAAAICWLAPFPDHPSSTKHGRSPSDPMFSTWIPASLHSKAAVQGVQQLPSTRLESIPEVEAIGPEAHENNSGIVGLWRGKSDLAPSTAFSPTVRFIWFT